MKEELVSIIMPSYNTGKFIGETINSVIDQTYINWELIIVDDCSSDNTDCRLQLRDKSAHHCNHNPLGSPYRSRKASLPLCRTVQTPANRRNPASMPELSAETQVHRLPS